MSGRKGERDAHSVMIERWLHQVLADPQMRQWAVFAVAWALSCHFNRKTKIAFAAVKTYERLACVERRAVQRALARLVAAGHLAVTRGGGRKSAKEYRTNKYRMILKASADGAALSDQETAADGPPFPNEVTAADGPPFKHGNSGPWTQVTAVHEPQKQRSMDRPTADRPLKGTADSPRAGARGGEKAPDFASRGGKATAAEIAAAFERFWAVYPKRVAKRAARRAFAAAVKAGADPEAMIANAAGYARERAGQDARFTKHPATWINECWEDDPPGGVVLDGRTGEMVADVPRRRGEQTWADVAAEVIAEGGDGERD